MDFFRVCIGATKVGSKVVNVVPLKETVNKTMFDIHF